MRKFCLCLMLLLALAATTNSFLFWRRRRCNRKDCVWGSWGSWGSCSPRSGSCGSGTQKRHRGIIRASSCGGRGCSGSSTSTRYCRKCCPVNCAWGSWGSWGSCYVSGQCGSGTQKRSRSYIRTPSCGGRKCSGLSYSRRYCYKCCPVNCVWGSWGSWSACAYRSGGCGAGTQARRRHVSRPSSCGGTGCAGSSVYQRHCSKCCPVNCVWGSWGSWGTCSFLSGNCGSGNARRTRSIHKQASCGGSCPGPNVSTHVCHKCCPQNCKWSSWGPWSECSKECGRGMRKRSRTVTSHATCGGSCSGTHEVSSSCNPQCCPVNCEWGPWGPWGSCRGKCPGRKTRQRNEKVQASCGGTSCTLKGSRERSKCNRQC